jgi:hypothetical protein
VTGRRFMNIAIVFVYFVVNLAVLIYLKFKIGAWGYCTFLMHLAACILRLFP